jgi:bacterioferritin-associated ferredoxin
MYVCVCRAVTESQIEAAVEGGARSLRDLRIQLGVTEECGRCAQCAKECLKAAIIGLSAADAAPALRPLCSPNPQPMILEAA